MRTAKTLTAAAGMAVATALLASMVAPAQAATVGTLTGFTGTNGDINAALGPLCQLPNICYTIVYNTFNPNPFDPAAQGAVTSFVNTTTGEEILVGYSLGGAILTVWIRNHPDPAGEDLRFITFGNPLVGSTPGTVAYPVTEVIHEYDNAVDPPQEWWNLLAVLNFAVSGRHCCYNYSDLTTTDARVYVDGNVTYRLIDTYPLPIIAGLDPSITVWLDPILRPIIDSAYHRTYQQYPEVSPTTAVTSTQEVLTWAEPATTVALTTSPQQTPSPPKTPPRGASQKPLKPAPSDPPPKVKPPTGVSSTTGTTTSKSSSPKKARTPSAASVKHAPKSRADTAGPSASANTPRSASTSHPKPKHEPGVKQQLK